MMFTLAPMPYAVVVLGAFLGLLYSRLGLSWYNHSCPCLRTRSLCLTRSKTTSRSAKLIHDGQDIFSACSLVQPSPARVWISAFTISASTGAVWITLDWRFDCTS
ncbi:hypothetical protein C8R47DRAFT_209012 [Mycena vitilis]|nr:hypothetical protein C8R47DRAFT_209012 [Mycena vitilis]